MPFADASGNQAQSSSVPAGNSLASAPLWRSDVALLAYLALATVFVHVATGWRYGFHRDELSVLDDAQHLAWGYVAYPPMTPFFARIALALFGTSLSGFRLFAALAQAAGVFLTGLMARELGAGGAAQLLAALAAVPFALGGGALMQYIAFDYLCWTLAAYFVVRLLKSGTPRWWLAIGTAIGLGMLAKYTMGFFALGIAGATLLSKQRRDLKTIWLWLGVVLSVLLFLPNLVWQMRHNWVSLAFLQFIHTRDVGEGLAANFLLDQLELTMLAFPLAAAGLYFFLVRREGQRFRMIGWIYVLTLVLYLAAKGRGYYLAPAYPMLYAGGAVLAEHWLASQAAARRRLVSRAAWSALLLDVIIAAAFVLPIAPVNSTWWRFASRVGPLFPEQIGWVELTETVAQIRDSLPLDQREHLGILTENYGEVGALNLYGPHYGLPRAISGVNSFWERGYGNPAPQVTIIVGFPATWVNENFHSCRLAARSWNRYGIANEETIERNEIYLCGPPKAGWPAFWQHYQYFA